MSCNPKFVRGLTSSSFEPIGRRVSLRWMRPRARRSQATRGRVLLDGSLSVSSASPERRALEPLAVGPDVRRARNRRETGMC